MASTRLPFALGAPAWIMIVAVLLVVLAAALIVR